MLVDLGLTKVKINIAIGSLFNYSANSRETL